MAEHLEEMDASGEDQDQELTPAESGAAGWAPAAEELHTAPATATLDSRVEAAAIEASGYELIYGPEERVPSIIVENFPSLGRLTACRFLEWVQQNPEGVCSLPTGKTPEYFIKYVTHYMRNWDERSVRDELESLGVDTSVKPEMHGLRFVQIDEFYPIDTRQHNSFNYYVKKFYLRGFGMDPARAMLIDPTRIGVPQGYTLEDIFPDETVDLAMRIRKPKSRLEKRQQEVLNAVDQFCTEYERRVRALGGIGFFLGGIGPDGHIAFNIRGSDFYSTTRLCEPNYETRAAAASDLGGIHVAGQKHVITIGLRTITHNPDTVAIIIAAGEAKAHMVASTIHSSLSNQYPGSALQVLPRARFYLTRGAAVGLHNRQFVDFTRKKEVGDEQVHRIVMDLSLNNNKPILTLQREDFTNDRFGSELMQKTQRSHEDLAEQTHRYVLDSLMRGNARPEKTSFLHTAPHHDDIILGYMPYVTNAVRRSSNQHTFSYMTSGFNAVTNAYMYDAVKDLLDRLNHGEFAELINQGYFDPSNQLGAEMDLSYYHEGAAVANEDKKTEAISRRLLRNMVKLYEDDAIDNLKQRCVELLNYFKTQYPGKKDMALVQQLKGRVREWESDLKWASYGFVGDRVRHLRLAFYKGELFTEPPRVDRDVPPILELLLEVKPDIVTVAFDPEGSGPDTHYKVLQAISAALKQFEQEHGHRDVQVLGYRNVWFRFHPSEANLFIPCSMTHLNDMDDTFDTCFNTQRTAAFPSYELDGPFSALARKIQTQQYRQVLTFLGEDFFVNNEEQSLRACRGIVYLRQMSLQEFYTKSYELRQVAEAAT